MQEKAIASVDVERAFAACPDLFSMSDMVAGLAVRLGLKVDDDGRVLRNACDRYIRKAKKDGDIELEGRIWRKTGTTHPVRVASVA